jgi:hypothetical protein
LIDPKADVIVNTLTTNVDLTVKGELKIQNTAILKNIQDLLEKVKGLETSKVNRGAGGDSIQGTLNVKALIIDGNKPVPSNIVDLVDSKVNRAGDTITGNLGIGTAGVSAQKLIVQGNWNTGKDANSGMGNSGQLAIKGNAAQLDFIDTDNPDWAIHVNSGRMYFIREPWTYDSLILDSTGNVGIGTEAPGSKLTVQGVHNASKDPQSGMSYGGQFAIKGNAPQIDFIDTDHPDWAIHVNSGRMYFIREPWNTDSLILDFTGKVGIGTDSPSEKLEVTGRIKAGRLTIGAWPANANYDFIGTTALDQTNAANYALLQSAMGGDIGHTFLNSPSAVHLRIGNVDKMTIDANSSAVNGNLLVTGASTIKLGLEGNGGGQLVLCNNKDDNKIFLEAFSKDGKSSAAELLLTGISSSNVPRLSLLADNTYVGGNLIITGRLTGNLDYLVSSDGNFKLFQQGDANLVTYNKGGGAIWSSFNGRVSDINLKKNLSPLNNALKKILSLRGVSFEWKDENMGKKREMGVIAQEVEKVFPELVSTITDRKLVSYDGLISALIEAIKEQQTQIDALTAAVKI